MQHDAKQLDVFVGVFCGKHAEAGRFLRGKHNLELFGVCLEEKALEEVWDRGLYPRETSVIAGPLRKSDCFIDCG